MEQKSLSWAKLDTYDYELTEDKTTDRVFISIKVESSDDSVIADIATAINQNDEHIYVEGNYLIYENMAIIYDEGHYRLFITARPYI